MAYALWKRRHRVDRFVTGTLSADKVNGVHVTRDSTACRDLHVKLIVRTMEHGIYREIKVKFEKDNGNEYFELNNGLILNV